jgi:hypothetical protein
LANVFVFGSNLAGRHGKGAALFALKNHGAIYGQGFGRQGNSFAIPTKDANLQVLSLEYIHHYIKQFIDYAHCNSDDTFMLTPIGTGLAGYSREQIYSLLKQLDVPSNVLFTKEWFNL